MISNRTLKQNIKLGENMAKPIIYSYMANSVPEVKQKMLKELGLKDIEDLYVDIPNNLRLKKNLNVPPPKSEYEVRSSITKVMAKNITSDEMLCFLGAGCWPHHVPAVCDEINARAEFYVNYFSTPLMSPGAAQTLFEYHSMLGELIAMDAVDGELYDWATTCGEAARMSYRITGRDEILVSKIICPDRLSVMRNYCDRLMDVKLIDYDSETGLLDIEDLKSKISSNTAGVYIENPSYLGFIEPQGKEISEIAHDKGALSIVGVEPTSLGILTPPGEYGADIVIGESQPLGMHMSYGGALCGFIAYPAEFKFLQETPRGTSSLATTEHEGVWSFVGIRSPRSMYTARERGTSFTGTGSALWGITAAVYMALMGPQGMQDLGEVIIEKSHYAMKLISEIKGVKTPLFNSTHFEEFTVNFDDTGKTVKEVNKALLKNGIQGGKDVTKEFPELGSTALYCVTEIHAEEDLEKLANVLREVIK